MPEDARLGEIAEEYGISMVVAEMRDAAQEAGDRAADVELCNGLLEALEGRPEAIGRESYVEDHPMYEASMEAFRRSMDHVSRVAEMADHDGGYALLLRELAADSEDRGLVAEADVLNEVLEQLAPERSVERSR